MCRLGLRNLISLDLSNLCYNIILQLFREDSSYNMYADLIEMLLKFLVSQVNAKLLKTAREVRKQEKISIKISNIRIY